MAKSGRIERRTDALSKERIIGAAIEILDSGGESGLTFRALAARLTTGSGAIYWHVEDKDELLAAATEEVIDRVMSRAIQEAEPREAIRAVALGLFDAIDAHPWAGAQLSRAPWQPAVGRIFESIGSQLDALGVPGRALFDAASLLVHYILGAAGQNAQNAANARLLPPGTDREAFLSTVVERWTRSDPTGYPFLHRTAAQFHAHDDREQFLAGVDLILVGIGTLRRDSQWVRRTSPAPG
ncbi:MAG: TetR/AcrR family transcriptional regulator [Mesorhizobium sp.]|uniref:TetR/AcrR family transcriptional regulator n=1 Tax=Mesorhizobium sp. TaxID=1871066 RepID=UPI000FE9B57B|nr:TetR/AcrR family transcriptional regulator [Mesorhizobium sp.]RWM04580.1 MAG: TetR/AcrR family transcriptional regulator [Mesorhizobium sp.]TIP01717.1 MAG: TetR family transcriptional regulator [Mesorhizobium sp.]TIP40692.1 MAG: TetR family transcriptional regulator [Mesorhizobium sp.]